MINFHHSYCSSYLFALLCLGVFGCGGSSSNEDGAATFSNSGTGDMRENLKVD